MNYLIAIFLPALSTLLCGHLFLSILLAFAQLTIIGWIPATIVAWLVIKDKKLKKAMNSMAKLQRKEKIRC